MDTSESTSVHIMEAQKNYGIEKRRGKELIEDFPNFLKHQPLHTGHSEKFK